VTVSGDRATTQTEVTTGQQNRAKLSLILLAEMGASNEKNVRRQAWGSDVRL